MELSRDFVQGFAGYLDLPTDLLDPERVTRFVSDLWTLADGLPDSSEALYAAQEPPPASRAPIRPIGRRDDADWHEISVVDVSQRLRAGAVRPTELVAHTLERIHRLDPELRSFITVADDRAMLEAERLEGEMQAGRWRGPLHGVPISVKDSIPVAGLRWTANSRVHETRYAARDARAIARLRRAGAIVVGKNNLNEFGWSIPAESDLTAPPRNPWRRSEYAVGSSSGSGAAVAARLSHAAIGTDGGGSTRLPAGQENLFGLKPSLRAVPREGYADGHLSLSEIGFLTRDARDLALLLSAATTSEDQSDEALIASQEAVLRDFETPPRHLRVAAATSYVESTAPEEAVLVAYRDTVARLRNLGFTVEEVPESDLPELRLAVAANFVVLCAEAWADHERTYRQHAPLYGESARHYLVQGAFLPASSYLRALTVRERVTAQVDSLLSRFDLLLLPTSPVTSTTAARNPATHRKGGNAQFTAPFNLSGHPGLSFPSALSPDGIPIGMQFVGRYGSELDLLHAAHVAAQVQTFPSLTDIAQVGAEGG